MKQRSNTNGSNENEWETPDYIFDNLNQEFGLNYDLACKTNNIKTVRGSMLDKGNDGLLFEPFPYCNVWCNPPYNRQLKELFIKKCYELSKHPYVKFVIMLIPATMETKIMHDVVFPNGEVRCLKRRIPFKGYNTKGEYVTKKTGQTGSLIVIFGKSIIPKIIPYNIKED